MLITKVITTSSAISIASIVDWMLMNTNLIVIGRDLLDNGKRGGGRGMNFIIINDYSNSEDRLRIKSDEPITSQFKQTKTVGVLIQVTKDFDPYSNEIQIVRGTDSYQIRPKAIFMNKNNDYYWMYEGKRVYLSENEVKELDRFLVRVRAMEGAE